MNTQSSEGFKIRPPLGIVPEWVWKEQRHKELDDAIHRYIAAGEAIPVNWIAEHYAIGQWIRNREEEKSYTSKDNLASGSNVAGNGKDCEIVSFKSDWGIVVSDFSEYGRELDWYLKSVLYSIHSVRRLSDSVIFSIGDKITGRYFCIGSEVREIKSFYLNQYGYLVIKQDGGESKLEHIEKAPITKTEALFKDYLGNDVFEGDKFWFVEFNLEIGEAEPASPSSGRYSERKYFKEKIAAHQYVSENKPQYSIRDFKDILIRYDYAIDMMEDVFNELKYLGKLNEKK